MSSSSSEVRNELRSKLLSKHHVKKVSINIFGIDIELRQPSLGDILKAKYNESSNGNIDAAANIIIEYAYVPGTDERIFEAADKQQILNWPFGDDLIELQTAIGKLTNIDITKSQEEISKNPSKG